MIPTVVVHCAALGRSLDHIRAHVPDVIVFDAPVAPLDRLVYPMDYMLGRLGAKAVVTVPFVAIQAPGVSGYLGRFTDYATDYAEREQRLMGGRP